MADLTNREALELLDAVVETVGSGAEDDIVVCTENIATVKEHFANVDATLAANEEEIARLNETNRGLRQSNNLLSRKIDAQTQTIEEKEKDKSTLDMLNMVI